MLAFIVADHCSRLAHVSLSNPLGCGWGGDGERAIGAAPREGATVVAPWEGLVKTEVVVEALERAIGAARKKMTTNFNKMLEEENVQRQEKKRFLRVQEVALCVGGTQVWSEVLDTLKIFMADVENQHDIKIKVVRSDHVGEYYSWHTPYVHVHGPFARFL
jgi:hypothetical protein